MKLISSISELKREMHTVRIKNQSVGLVPTMGYLHEGHVSLMKRAATENDVAIVSIFVNPTQFAPNEDLEAYPRNLEGDLAICKENDIDFVFAPSVKEMYPENYATYLEVEGAITKTLCGASRTHHFKGVTTIVSKLFNLTHPTRAYFGQKDYQQAAVIKKMTRELNYDVEIITCPIIREADGLALSSRNSYLNETERVEALILSESLKLAEKKITSGETDAIKIIDEMKALIQTKQRAEIEYIQIVDPETLEDILTISGHVVVAIAVKIGKTRLIDNLYQ